MRINKKFNFLFYKFFLSITHIYLHKNYTINNSQDELKKIIQITHMTNARKLYYRLFIFLS